MANPKTVAIIGAGISGLAAAKLLCDKGFAVEVFEANAKTGGSCATTSIGGYTFNDGACYLALPGLLDRLFSELGLDRGQRLPLRQVAAAQSAILPDGDAVDITGAPRPAISCSSGTTATVRAQMEMATFLARWQPTLRFFADEIIPRPFSAWRLLSKGWPHLSRLRGTVATHLKAGFSSEAVRAALGGMLLFNGLPPHRMPAASLLGLVAAMRDGYFVPEGGMGRLADVLSNAVREKGGRIHLGAPVRRILIKSGRAAAVDVEGVGPVDVDAVISSVSAMMTFGPLIAERDVPSSIRRKLRRVPLSHRSFILQLGLRNKVDARSHTICVLPWLEDQSAVFDTTADIRWPVYNVPTVTLPEAAPQGCSIVEMFVPVGNEMSIDDWSEARKEEFAARAVDALRRYHDLDIAVSRILSPKEFLLDLHLYAGALYGISPVAGPAALFKHRTPIHGLYQAGQTTWPGFGVVPAGLSGVFAAQELVRNKLA